MLDPFHDTSNVRINDAALKPWPILNPVKAKKKRILKIPSQIKTAPAIMFCAGVKPMQQERAQSKVAPLHINITIEQWCVAHSSVNSGRRKQFSTLLTNFID